MFIAAQIKYSFTVKKTYISHSQPNAVRFPNDSNHA